MILDILKDEIRPLTRGNERVYIDNVLCSRSQPNEAADDEIAEGGVVVILATLPPTLFYRPAPLTRLLIRPAL
jgi:hypothetical protein